MSRDVEVLRGLAQEIRAAFSRQRLPILGLPSEQVAALDRAIVVEERLRVVAAGARALALATTDPAAKVELERLAKLAEEGGR